MKEVKREVLDVSALRERIDVEKESALMWTGRWMRPRLVMSHNTKHELIRECNAHGQYACYGGGGGKVTFEGCEIDINDSLAFCEILFTVELRV